MIGTGFFAYPGSSRMATLITPNYKLSSWDDLVLRGSREQNSLYRAVITPASRIF